MRQAALKSILAFGVTMAAMSASLAATNDAANLPVEIVPQLTGPTTSISFSPDGRLILAGGRDNTARLWDAVKGRLLRTFIGHSDEVTSVAFSADGRQILTGSQDHTVREWEAASGKLLRTFDTLHFVNSVAFSPDGSRILAGGGSGSGEDGTARLWDSASGQLLRTFVIHAGALGLAGITSVAFSPDGSAILTGSEDSTAKLWSAANGRLLRTFKGHSDYVSSVAFSPDGARVLTGSFDYTTKLWDAASGHLLRTLKTPDHVSAAVFSPNGGQILTGGYAGAALWDATSGQLLHMLAGSGAVSSVAFSPEGTRIFISSETKPATLWDAASGQFLQSFDKHLDIVHSVALSPDGSQVLSGDDEAARLWDSATGRLLHTYKGRATTLAFAPDGGRFVTGGDRTAKLWDLAGAGPLRTFGGDAGSVNAVAFSPDGTHLLTSEGGRAAKLWDVKNGQLLRAFLVADSNVSSVAVSRDGKQALVGDEGDDTAYLWNTADGRLLHTFAEHSAFISSVAFSPDGGRVLTGSGDETAKLWDAVSGQLLHTFEGHSQHVNTVAFSPDGGRILTGSDDNSLRSWDATSGKLLHTFEGTAGHVNSVAFSPDGRRIVSGSSDSTTRFWDSGTGAQLASSIAFANGEWVTITPEGFFDASPHGAENLVVVRGLESYSIDQAYQALYRPDLVAAKLAGDPDGKVAAAAAQLDLTKVIGSGPAPKVTITSPSEGASVDADSVDVDATVTDAGGGIGKIEWRVNGVTLGIGARGFDRLAAGDAASGSGKTVSVKQTLSLDPGDNRIEVVAYNEKGLIASEPVAVTVKWDGASASTPPKLYVLAVGVNDYWDGRLKLTYAAPDAKAIGEAFRQSGEKLYSGVDVTTVLDADVTAAHLDQVFADEAKKVKPRDVFVFFMAGHGKTQDGRYYFLPQDFRYEDASSIAKSGIDQDRLQAWFAEIPARKSVLLYDTCDSGSLTAAGAGQRGLEQVAALERMTRAMGRTVLSASTDDAPALEGYKGHGVFTYAVLDALGDADANKDGMIEVTELAGAIDRNVPDISYAAFKLRQVPQMSLVGSDFPLTDQVAVLDASADTAAAAIPAEPTHVVIATANVEAAAGSDAPPVATLPVGTLVRVIETKDGWTLIAKGGKQLGYVEDKTLAVVQ